MLVHLDPHAAEILLIEDDPDDEALTCRVLRRNQFTNITVIRDGAEALDYLFARGAFAHRDITDQPMLTLLDLNLPKIGGLAVLKAIRADLRTMLLPVVILSGSRDDHQRHAARHAGANGFMIKSDLLTDFSAQITALVDYWMITKQKVISMP